MAVRGARMSAANRHLVARMTHKRMTHKMVTFLTRRLSRGSKPQQDLIEHPDRHLIGSAEVLDAGQPGLSACGRAPAVAAA
jgi:hypothetical protein